MIEMLLLSTPDIYCTSETYRNDALYPGRQEEEALVSHPPDADDNEPHILVDNGVGWRWRDG